MPSSVGSVCVLYTRAHVVIFESYVAFYQIFRYFVICSLAIEIISDLLISKQCCVWPTLKTSLQYISDPLAEKSLRYVPFKNYSTKSLMHVLPQDYAVG